MKRLTINLNNQSYNILIKRNLKNDFGIHIKEVFNGKKICIITDNNLNKLYGVKISQLLRKHGFEIKIISIVPGEKSKDFSNLAPIYESLLDFNLTRSDLIVALGGGVVGDLSGFVASTFLRGIDFVQIPTSLLAQVDSSVGGKVAVDLDRGKNLIGSFYHPKLVLIDTAMLDTLPDKFFNDGIAEVIKYGCIKDSVLFDTLSTSHGKMLKENIGEIIYRCCEIKKQVVETDEKDKGNRMILNFGHTLGHAIEKIYGFEKYSHGEGVAIGMYMITKISEQLGLTKAFTSDKIKNTLVQYNLPFKIDVKDENKLLDTIKLDKKNLNGDLNIILINDIGKSFIYKTDINFFKQKE